MDIPKVPVTAIRRGRVWFLYFADPCPWCGKRHQHYHGGGDGPEPSYGSRTTHCLAEGAPPMIELVPE